MFWYILKHPYLSYYVSGVCDLSPFWLVAVYRCCSIWQCVTVCNLLHSEASALVTDFLHFSETPCSDMWLQISFNQKTFLWGQVKQRLFPDGRARWPTCPTCPRCWLAVKLQCCSQCEQEVADPESDLVLSAPRWSLPVQLLDVETVVTSSSAVEFYARRSVRKFPVWFDLLQM